MVIAEISGGLGNQMFQYAFGLATAKRCESPLFLDLRPLEKRDHDEDLARKIENLLDADARRRYSEAGRKRVSEHFAEATMIQNLKTIYNGLIGSQ